jgi:hypothetical protein
LSLRKRFQRSFAAQCLAPVSMYFLVDEPDRATAARIAGSRSLIVLPAAALEVIGNTGVERVVRTAHHVDIPDWFFVPSWLRHLFLGREWKLHFQRRRRTGERADCTADTRGRPWHPRHGDGHRQTFSWTKSAAQAATGAGGFIQEGNFLPHPAKAGRPLTRVPCHIIQRPRLTTQRQQKKPTEGKPWATPIGARARHGSWQLFVATCRLFLAQSSYPLGRLPG